MTPTHETLRWALRSLRSAFIELEEASYALKKNDLTTCVAFAPIEEARGATAEACRLIRSQIETLDPLPPEG